MDTDKVSIMSLIYCPWYFQERLIIRLIFQLRNSEWTRQQDSIIGYKSPNSVVLCEDVFHHALSIHSSSKFDRPEQQCYQLYTSLFHRLYLKRHPRFQEGQAQCQRAMHYWNTPSEPASTTGTLLDMTALSNVCALCHNESKHRGQKEGTNHLYLPSPPRGESKAALWFFPPVWISLMNTVLF